MFSYSHFVEKQKKFLLNGPQLDPTQFTLWYPSNASNTALGQEDSRHETYIPALHLNILNLSKTIRSYLRVV